MKTLLVWAAIITATCMADWNVYVGGEYVGVSGNLYSCLSLKGDLARADQKVACELRMEWISALVAGAKSESQNIRQIAESFQE